MVGIDCQSCKDWKTCAVPPEWFSYQHIRWCPYQIIWLLQNAHIFRAGRWPPEHRNTGYENGLGRQKVKTEASFVKPELVIGELECRLQRTGKDGIILEAEIEGGKGIDNLRPESWQALMYIKGWRRKRVAYRRWLRQVYHAKTVKI